MAALGGSVQNAGMSRLSLIRLPSSPSAVTGVSVEATRTAGGVLALRFVVSDPEQTLVLPDPTPAVRTDGLWHRTCFEAFLQPPDGDGYHELNLAPCGAWAAYRFDSRRVGMADADVPAPRITSTTTASGFELQARIDLSEVAALAGPWRVSLTAVIEGPAGELSYWALAYPDGDSDFHNPAARVLTLESAG